MKQAVFIHGGETFETYDAYLDALRSWSYSPQPANAKRWKHTLPERLDDEWEVFMPLMPNKQNAKYEEWCIWFEKVIPHLKDDVVLVGHSLGGLFLAKYLDEHTFPVSVRATFLVAAPFDTRDPEFSISSSLDTLPKQAGKLFLYQSIDDPEVPFSALETFRSMLPDAEVRIFSDRGHIMQPEFSELVEDILSV